MAGILRLSNTGTGNGQSTITTAASGDTTYTLPSGGGTFVTTSSTQALTVPFASGTVSAPSITFLGDSNTGLYSPAADTIAFTEGGVESLRIDSSGRLGIGTASPGVTLHLNATNPGIRLEDSDASGTPFAEIFGSSGNLILQADAGAEIASSNIQFLVDGNEAARIDSSGRLLVGTSSARANLFNSNVTASLQCEATASTVGAGNILTVFNGDVSGSNAIIIGKTRAASVGGATVVQSGDDLGFLSFQGADGTELVEAARITATVDGTPGANDMPGRLVFSTTADGASSPTERMRIDSAGRLQLGTTNNLGRLNSKSNSSTEFAIESIQDSATGSSILAACNSNDTTGRYFVGYSTSASSNRIIIYTNGNIQNTNNSYGSLSDIKLKENIVDANSQWDDLKALQVRNYNLKEGQTHKQIGLIAQEVEPISPGLVYESPDRDAEGNDLGTVTKSVNYSVLYMKAVKALQEAMERIETLEADVAALKAQ